MRTITQTLYFYDELPSEKAKEKAREWWRRHSATDGYRFAQVLDDASEIASCLGVVLDKVHGEPAIYYQVNYAQGDGAGFSGSWCANRVNIEGLQQHAPEDAVLREIASKLGAVAIGEPSAVSAVSVRRSIEMRFIHMSCSDANAGIVVDALKAFAEWIYEQLCAIDEYENSDETVAENIRINEYEFDEEGNRA